MRNALFLAALLWCHSLVAVQAAVVITAQDVGSDLVFSYSGQLNLSGLDAAGNNTFPSSGITPNLGSITSYTSTVATFEAASLPSFGGASFLTGGTSTGDNFAIFSNGFIGLPLLYNSGDALSGTLTLSSTSISSALLKVGSYTSTFSNGDTISLHVGPQPVPVPAGLPLLVGGLGLIAVMKRRSAR